MWKLRVQNPEVEIVDELKDGMRMYFNGATGDVQEGDFGPMDFFAVLSRPDTYYLVDGTYPLTYQCGRRAHTLQLATPEEESVYKSFEKERGVLMFFVAVWPYSELEAARCLIYTNVSAEKLRENYELAGGSIRLCLVKQHYEVECAFDVRALIDEAVTACNVEETLSTNGLRANRSSAEYLLHAIVEDEDTCRCAPYDFASSLPSPSPMSTARYIARALLEHQSMQVQEYVGGDIGAEHEYDRRLHRTLAAVAAAASSDSSSSSSSASDLMLDSAGSVNTSSHSNDDAAAATSASASASASGNSNSNSIAKSNSKQIEVYRYCKRAINSSLV